MNIYSDNNPDQVFDIQNKSGAEIIRRPEMNRQDQLEIEAATFRRLLSHLAKRTDVQNIDLMGLGGFCRNCLANWYQEAAQQKDITLDKAEAREIIYGMPYGQWVEKYQGEATAEQLTRMEESLKKNQSM